MGEFGVRFRSDSSLDCKKNYEFLNPIDNPTPSTILGIVGAMLSGISMANLHVLQGG